MRLLNVYPDEWSTVKSLYMLQFFQGAGIAFFFTSAFAQFLEEFPITELPWVMLCSAGFLWIAGYLYAKLEHAFSFKTFNIGTMLVTTLSMLIFWFADHEVTGKWFFYLMMSWFYVLYLIDNLGFWGIAATLFDVRQSKRLFAVISAGDIPAKFFGYTLALIIVPYTGTRHLVLIGAACMMASLPSFFAILRAKKQLKEQHQDHSHSHQQHKPKKIGKVISNIVTNTYIRRIALISLISSCCVILFNYGLYGEVAKAYHADVELATFIAFFYASIRIVAFITKMFLTSRLTVSMGVKSALFITPIGMMILIGAIIAVSTLSSDRRLIFYMFGVTSILVEVLRTSFNTPVLLTLMQPLPIHERLRAHNIVKGIMDPFAFFITGVVLLTVNYLGKKADLIHLCYSLLVLAGLWIIGVILVNRRYVAILIKTISSRYFSRDEFELNDENVMSQIKQRITKGSETEVISILNMLNSKRIDKVAEELILELLHHPSDRIKIESIHVVATRNFTNAQTALEQLFSRDIHESVRTEAIKAYCKIGSGEIQVLTYLNHEDDSIRYAAISGMIANSSGLIRKQAESALTDLLFNSSIQEKKKGIAILQEVSNIYNHSHHSQLIEDENFEVSELAIKATGSAADDKTIRALFSRMTSHEKSVLSALYNVGPNAVSLISDQIANGFLSLRLEDKLVTLLGKIGGTHAIELLIKLLREQKHTTSVIRALHRCKYSADDNTRKELESIARVYLVHGVELLNMQQTLSKEQTNYEVLNNSLHYEIQNIREILLSLFGCLYDRDKMNQVKYGLSAKSADSTANAMEIIEVTVKKDIGRSFNTLFETTPIEQRCQSLRALFTEAEYRQAEQVLKRILSEKPIDYYTWTKACSLYISKKHDYAIDAAIFDKFAASDNKLLKETALFADSKLLT